MSRWLKSVNNLLETLDGKAETVADGQAIGKFLETGRDAVAAGLGPRRTDSMNSSSDEEYEEEEYEEDEEELVDDDDEVDDDEEVEVETMEETWQDDLASEPAGVGANELEAALKDSVDPDQEAVSLAMKRRRPEYDDNTVSDISFSEYTEEEVDGEDDDLDPSGDDKNSKLQPPSSSPPTGSAAAPPNPPNRYAPHPQQVEDMAKGSSHNIEVNPSSNHTQGTGKNAAVAIRSAPTSFSNPNNNAANSKQLSSKCDESPRPPRRSVEAESTLPMVNTGFLDDTEPVTEAKKESDPATTELSDTNHQTVVDDSTAPPRLPSRQASFPTSQNNDAPNPADTATAPVNKLPTIAGSPGDNTKKRVSPSTAPGTMVKPSPPPLSSGVNPKHAKEFQKLKDKLQAAQAQLSKTSAALRTSQTQVQSLQTQNQTLESKLDAANSEIVAQSEELRRAGERMEKDRLRAQEEREDLLDEQDEELDQLKQTHQKELDGLRNQYEAQIADLTQQLQTEETRRRQEGGDYTQELQDAIEREREALKQLQVVTTERTQLQTTVSKLEVQQTALQGKLDSALQSVKTAADREREAEDKLDAAMSLHSRQTSQRQAREAELENTIFQLGTALTVARQKQQNQSLVRAKESAPEAEGETFKDKYIAAGEEVDTLKVQLNLETQRREALQEELNDISRERAEEASSAQARQRLHDRKVSDLESTIGRLQATISEQKSALGKSAGNGVATESGHAVLTQELQTARREIESLTTQLVRHQNMTENSKSEILALKGRLQAATSRAEQAEQSLQTAQSARSSGTMSNNHLYEMEGGGMVGGVRRRVKGGAASRARTRTIRAALQMSPGRTNHPFMEQLATTLDAIDSWMVETGSFLRHEPLARLAFMLYLLTLHVWSFALVVFHTTEQPHGDFGSMDNNPRHWRAAVAAVHEQQQSPH